MWRKLWKDPWKDFNLTMLTLSMLIVMMKKVPLKKLLEPSTKSLNKDWLFIGQLVTGMLLKYMKLSKFVRSTTSTNQLVVKINIIWLTGQKSNHNIEDFLKTTNMVWLLSVHSLEVTSLESILMEMLKEDLKKNKQDKSRTKVLNSVGFMVSILKKWTKAWENWRILQKRNSTVTWLHLLLHGLLNSSTLPVPFSQEKHLNRSSKV